MKKIFILSSISLLSLCFTTYAKSTNTLTTATSKVSYTMGYKLGSGLKENGLTVSEKDFSQGFSAGIKGGKSVLSNKVMDETMKAFQKHQMQKDIAKQKELAGKNAKLSDAYMKKIAKEPGVKKIEDGLYYKVLKTGTGAKPTKNETVTVNYSGRLIDGKVFDSSYKRGEPATFKLDQVIPSWTKALEMMPVGSVWEVYIAPDLAYGKFGRPTIGPNQALTFKIDLIKVDKEKSGKK